ncbi:ADC synthase [Hysterangium stoloniferum]|nr:ADC synthase [Hysterangium stoloniferum]
MGPIAIKILLIDSYDSFTHNLAHLIRRTILHSEIYIINNDTFTPDTLLALLPSFSAVVIGPGPGSPLNAADVGVIPFLWNLSSEHILPVFGVCLGFQSLGLAFGGTLRTMRVVKHGMISPIEHEGRDLFENVAKDIVATRYHSLCVDIDTEQSEDSPLDILAWADDGTENGRVLMAACHRRKPFWGVQYHPESICTRGGGEEIIRNFWRLASAWTDTAQRAVRPLPHWAREALGDPWPRRRAITEPVRISGLSVESIILDLPNFSVTEACELLGANAPTSDFVVLDSAAKSGRFVIIGSLIPTTISIRYTLPDTHIILRQGTNEPEYDDLPPDRSIWDWLADFMRERPVLGTGCGDIPFWGGLIGYLSYELGVAELGIPLKHRVLRKKRNPDVNLIYVERSIVIDRETGRIYVQSLIPGDYSWLQETSCKLRDTTNTKPADALAESPLCSHLSSPSRDAYVPKVTECKYHLSVGSSYELCLTAPSTLRIPDLPRLSSWNLYKRLRISNPAPHAAYLRLGPTTLLCSSPERFVRWDRSGHCQLRPIKGTLRKTIVDGHGRKQQMGRKDAEELLGRNVKERAENLMIVDLVRHDLGGVVEAADGVKVDQLMVIEEYETVWQMVSAISGTVHPASVGWEVLRRSLPPGSMTGAPKKRSVELLQDIEGQERGVYSGVCGYWCVGGGGDWAVIIRSCFRYYEERGDYQEWTLGAGGAITALSDPVSEWDEMRVKLSSVGRAFGCTEF